MPRNPAPIFLLVAALVATGCDAPTAAPTTKGLTPGTASFSAAAGFVNTSIARANAGEINWHSNLDHFNVQLMLHNDADIEVTNGVVNAGGYSGWHYHPGPVLVLIKSGALTVYDGNDSKCRGTTYPAGTSYIEGTSPHIVRNEGTVSAEIVAVFFVPAGHGRRIEADPPGTCPF